MVTDHEKDVAIRLAKDDDEVLFKTKDGDFLSIPASIIDSWSPSQFAWANSPAYKHDPTLERYWRLAYKVYCQRAGIESLAVLGLKPRTIGRFQFWLRHNLERYGLI